MNRVGRWVLLRRRPMHVKILVPFLALLLAVGVAGTAFVVRDLSDEARATLNADLTRTSLGSRSLLHDSELYMLESVSFAANLSGMHAAVRRGDRSAVARLLGSVLALKSDLSLVAATDGDGGGLVEFTRAEPGSPPARTAGGAWHRHAFVQRALVADAGERHAGFVQVGDGTMLAIAAPICSDGAHCRRAGATLVGIRVEHLAAEAARAVQGDGVAAIYGSDGRLLAASTAGAPERVPEAMRGEPLRVTRDADSILFAPIEIRGEDAGFLSVSMSNGPALALARRAGMRVALIVFLAMLGIAGIGWLLARSILAQVRPLAETSNRLGGGELGARAPVVTEDELGDLARVLNQMAEQLQASHDTLEERVEQRTEEVQRLLRERTELFAGVSHELRTPLAVILSQAKMIRDPSHPKRAGWHARAAATIQDSAEQLLGVVNDLLELARVESGTLEVTPIQTSLAGVLEEVGTTAKGLAAGGRLKLTLEIAPALPDLTVDPVRLRSVLVNLVDNAVKYTPAGGHVTLAATHVDGSVEIAVSDDGPGIPGGFGDRIFEPFVTVPGVSPQRGRASTGLGLAFAKKLVEAQGGELSYTSRPGEGTTFVVRLAVQNDGRARVTSNAGR